MNQLENKFLFNFLLVCFAFAAFTACKENKKGSKEIEVNTTNSSESTACFEQFKTELMKMLTKDEIESAYQVDLADAELKSDIRDKYSPSASYKYYWPGDPDRSERLLSNGRDLGPINYKIGAGDLEFYKEDSKYIIRQFKNGYDLTDAKKAKAKEAINRELEKSGVDTKTKNTSKSISNSIIPELKFTPVEGIGDAAVWSHLHSSLIVLKGRTKFTVFVDVSDNHEEDIDLAKKLAKIILDKCQ